LIEQGKKAQTLCFVAKGFFSGSHAEWSAGSEKWRDVRREGDTPDDLNGIGERGVQKEPRP